jgi:hypothetical protein
MSVSDESADAVTSALLRAVGAVRAPEPRVFEDARRALWAVIASEMLGTGDAGRMASRGSTGDGEEDRAAARRRRVGGPPGEHKTAMGGRGRQP